MTIAIRRPKPKFRRTDPAQMELMKRLRFCTATELEKLEQAIQTYVSEGSIAPEIERLLSIPGTPDLAA